MPLCSVHFVLLDRDAVFSTESIVVAYLLYGRITYPRNRKTHIAKDVDAGLSRCTRPNPSRQRYTACDVTSSQILSRPRDLRSRPLHTSRQNQLVVSKRCLTEALQIMKTAVNAIPGEQGITRNIAQWFSTFRAWSGSGPPDGIAPL